jgi:hypothetical protein
MIETDTNDGIYNLPCTEMIVRLTDGRRVYLSEGFGGISSLEGGQYRWKYGIAIAIHETDTLETLHADTGEYNCDSYERMMAGYDETRPVLGWDGVIINGMALSVHSVGAKYKASDMRQHGYGCACAELAS